MKKEEVQPDVYLVVCKSVWFSKFIHFKAQDNIGQ